MNKIVLIALLLLSTLTLVTCSEGEIEENSKKDSSSKVEINLTGDDQMKFNLKTIVANEGDLVTIYFENIGKMAKEVMGHNFVLLESGVDLASFAAKAMIAKENDYIPSDEIDNIIVYSKLLGPGEKTLIEFAAPPKGTYKFICSFPGHYISMQGSLIVK